jgi:hypothetical protein
MQVYPKEQVDVVRHDDVFAAYNSFPGFPCHEFDKMIVKFLCCQYRLAVMRAEGDQVQGRVIFPEYGFQAGRPARDFLVHSISPFCALPQSGKHAPQHTASDNTRGKPKMV